MSKNSKRQRNAQRKQAMRNKRSLNAQKPSQPKVAPPPIDKSQLRFKWTFARNIGPGLINAFNTCFLNAVLCCLTYTAPLSQYLLTNNHVANCTVEGFCGLCAMTEHVNKCFTTAKSLTTNAAISPNYFTTNLKKISSALTLGRQEDAHEFFMFLLSSFTKSYTAIGSKLSSNDEEAGLVHLIFGGKLRSRVTCTQCKATSDSYDRFLDMSIDIKGQTKIKEALTKFVETDTIGADDTPSNGYNCGSCKNKVIATKKMTVEELPKRLVIHLKRFAFDLKRCAMRKVHNHVSFPAKLNMAPYLSPEMLVQSAVYKLYGVLVHEGSSCDSGHYYAYVKAPSGNWLMINDDYVVTVTEEEVLRQKAYMVFYEQVKIVTKDKTVTTTDSPSSAAPSLVSAPPVLKSCLKRKRDQEDLDASKPAATKKVKFEEICCAVATDPNSWVVRPVGVPFRSLLGNQSPRTFSNAVGHHSQWTIRDL
ncbi:hypothetical protein G6F56_006393 [Rhizopus delemar]|uniref:ubiquitinyl hydrolase 1 n=1 Tax=Rhizopus stolonifer TaxID=4846 RepID=A0A367J6R0_RHIST|nr:hypothetical protein G6F56_006393 [Rhizopus delemar]RCH85585.1 Ubiquitin carboxyl-terminal hydrolase 36 [Rhizopus stolonifer]